MPRPILFLVISQILAAVVASAFVQLQPPPLTTIPRRTRSTTTDVILLRYSSGDYLSSLASRSSAVVAVPPVLVDQEKTFSEPPVPSSSVVSSSVSSPQSVAASTTVSSSANSSTGTTTSTTSTSLVAVQQQPTVYPILANGALAPAAALSSSLSIPATVVPSPSLESGGHLDGFFSYASRSSFGMDLLTPKGPRANADVGDPHEASRLLVEFNSISVGSWWCSEGGWPSLHQRTTTEVFHVWAGHGCLTDMDGMRHFFGPGDTVILPKGWAGRWDIQEAVHKVWCINDHLAIEETSYPIRAVAIPHHKLVAIEVLYKHGLRSDAVHGAPYTASQVVYSVGPSTTVGCWSCTPGSFPIQGLSNTQFFHVLEGVFFVTNPDGSARRCTAGDTVVLPKGWSGMFDVVETVRKLNVVVQ